MYQPRIAVRPKDIFATVGAVWLALICGGLASGLASSRAAAAIVSLGVYAALLALYAFGAGPGRRSGITFFFAAFLYPLAGVAWMIVFLSGRPRWPELLVTLPLYGLNVGPVPRGGPDAHLMLYIPYWMLNMLAPLVAVLGLRTVLRYYRND